jgi:hypothetical protein
MTKMPRDLGRLATVAGVAVVGVALAGCGSSRSSGARDAGRGGAAGGTSAMGGAGAGGTVVGGGGAVASSGGLDTGGFGAGGLGTGGTGPSGGIKGGGGMQAGGAGGAAAGGLGAGGAEVVDASPDDVPMSLDSGSGGVASGGGTTAGGGTGAGGVTSTGGSRGTGTGGMGAGGVTSAGGSGGTGGAACTRVPGEDAVCGTQDYPPLAYFCPVPAQPPATTCVIYNGIGSGDYYCCPSQYSSCPAQRPANGTGCPATILGLTCTYGGDLDPTCRTSATCQNGAGSYSTWQVPVVTCNTPTLPADCPTTPTAGQACSPHGLACRYATGDYCECTGCNTEYPSCPVTPPPDAWYCWAPPADPCPTTHPNLGSACALAAATQCRYRCDLIATCDATGVWVDGGEKCPICNSPDTPIATPTGDRPIASLVPGDLVYSVHRGQVSIVPIAEVGRQSLHNHHVMRLLLATGTVLEISPGHPTADGRTLGDLAADDLLDGVRIVSATLVPYRHSHTYDILPASDTGTYYAGSALIGSTLAPRPRLASAPTPVCSAIAALR